MTLNELKDYFAGIAAELKDLQHSAENQTFFAVHNDENIGAFIRDLKNDTIMVLITPERKLEKPNGESYVWDKFVYLFILKRMARKPALDVWQAQHDCELIANEIFIRLHDDRYETFPTFDESTWVTQPVGPLSDSFYGHVCIFTIEDHFEPVRNPDLWV